MTAQRHIFDPGPATANLTDRQQQVLALLQAEPAGIRTLDVGIAIHTADKCAYCSPSSACKYAHPNALSILRALRKKNLAIQRKSGLWQSNAPVPTSQRDTGSFPEGF